MKEKYLDIIEKSLSAYSDERIRDYIDEVKSGGLREHGFPRLGVNIGILIANGRRTELMDTFIEMMDICCEQIPVHKAQNDFSVREICCLIMLLREKNTVSAELLAKWTERMALIDPWKIYNVVAPSPDTRDVSNWALFAAVSDVVRGVLCGIDTYEFVDWQISSQLLNLDSYGMYQDDAPIKNPMVYDFVPRVLFAFALMFGYKGKYAKEIEDMLDKTAELSLRMQSVTGEMPFGGRSNQFLNNETLLISYYELEATRFARKGDMVHAGQFKAAAYLSAEKVTEYLALEPISHIKNRYDVETLIGCEGYGYFNKYMITVASNLYMGYMFADDSIEPTVAPTLDGGYAFTTTEHFHKTFLNSHGYFIQFETNADTHYDANGIGRVHKVGCPSTICLSVPFPAAKPNYKVEADNESEMSLCCYAENRGKYITGASGDAVYTLVNAESDANKAEAVFDIALSSEIVLRQSTSLCENGIDIILSGAENIGFMLPVFDFDGQSHTEIAQSQNSISVKYGGATCIYGFDGEIASEYKMYYNRNGRYRVYRVRANRLHIVINRM